MERKELREIGINLVERLKALDFNEEWNYTINWNNVINMEAFRTNWQSEDTTNPIQRFIFSYNYKGLIRDTIKRTYFNQWCDIITNLKIGDELALYKLTFMHEIGHSYSAYSNKLNKSMKKYEEIVRNIFTLALMKEKGSIKAKLESRQIIYRLKYTEVFADNYMLSRTPFIFNTKLQKSIIDTIDIQKIYNHIISLYATKIDIKAAIYKKAKDMPTYDMFMLYNQQTRGAKIVITKEYDLYLQKIIKNKYYQKYREGIHHYIASIVEPKDTGIALYIAAVILNQIYYQIEYKKNPKFKTALATIEQIGDLKARNPINKTWMYVYGDNFAMVEFPKVWNSLIETGLL